jgi:hypothetical protein
MDSVRVLHMMEIVDGRYCSKRSIAIVWDGIPGLASESHSDLLPFKIAQSSDAFDSF